MAVDRAYISSELLYSGQA